MHSSPVARYLLLAYTGLIACATLYPLTGWRDNGVPPWAYLTAPWPRHWTAFDLGFNLLAYVPLGCLVVWAVYPLMRGIVAVVAALLFGALLSGSLEALQTYLPSRIPSLLDLLSNAGGAMLGGLIALPLTVPLLERSGFVKFRRSAFADGAVLGQGVAILSLWGFAQVFPEAMLFGNGRIADWIGLSETVPFSPAQYAVAEAAVTACQALAACLIAASLTTTLALRGAAAALLIVAGMGIKSMSFAAFFKAEHAFAWLTPGATNGLFAAALLVVPLIFLPRALKLFFAAIALTFAVVIVNLAPANPYHTVALAAWNQGRLLNFVGLMQVVSALWPFTALLYIASLAARAVDR